jgi:serine/threonine protein kinase/tetratricopeptide (TPR) repeat protein
MSPDRWRRVKEILDAVLDRSEAERPAALLELCDGDAELEKEIQSLLDACQQAGQFMEAPALRDNARLLMDELASPSATGKRIGPYIVLQEIGQGGMGTVYRAARADQQFEKQVAIKIVKRGMDTEFVLRRFRNERQILADLEHPNIARLLDGGVTDDGLPYFVMEYIEEGRPITSYCDEQRLSTADRLKLFQTVCAAVHYAHQRRVIHRDIKPGNILINREGLPKLLDFGIAKILDPEITTQSGDPTVTMMRLMTPEYASPEQVRGFAVTPASDVYSLGVLLYELLTGHRPYRLLTRAHQELIEVICESEPRKPSHVVRTTEEINTSTGTVTVSPGIVGRNRAEDSEKLRRRLAGDLDNIVLMAMRKEPRRRYASVEQFSEDIRRHLAGLPVIARNDTLGYRASKFVKRHKVGVLASLVVVLLFCLGLWALTSAPGWHRPLAPRRSVAVLGFRNLGRAESAWLSAALTEMLSTELAAGEKLRIVPGENVARFKQELTLPEAPSFAKDTLARIRTSLGADYVLLGTYYAPGDRDGSLRLDLRLQDSAAGETIGVVTHQGAEKDLLNVVSRVGARLRETLGVGDISSADARLLRASQPSNPLAARLYSQGLEAFRKYETLAARELFEKGTAADPNHALSHAYFAMVLSSIGDDTRARDEAKKAFDLSANLPREDRLFVEGRYYETINSFEKAIETYRTLVGFFPDSVDYGIRLAETLATRGQSKEALAVVDSMRKMLPPPASQDPRLDLAEAAAAAADGDYARQQVAAGRAADRGLLQGSRILVARARWIEGRAFDQLGEPKMAVARLEDSKRLNEQSGYQRGVALASNSLAVILAKYGDLDGALKLHEEALKISRQIGNRSGIAGALNQIGSILRQQGRFDEARKMHQEALELRRQLNDRAGIVACLNNLGNVDLEQGHLSQARELHSQALAAARELGNNRTIARAMQNLAASLRAQGALDAANQLNHELLALQRKINDRAGATATLRNIGQVQHDRGELAAAMKSFEDALSQSRGEGDKRGIGQALYGIGYFSLEQGDLPRARKSLEEALALSTELNDNVASTQRRIGLSEVALAQGRADQALALAQKAVEESRNDKSPRREAFAQVQLAMCLVALNRPDEARQAIEHARRFHPGPESRTLYFSLETTGAQVRAATGDTAGAMRELAKLRAQAAAATLPRWELEARLAMALLARKRGDPAAAGLLAEVQRDATRRGFGLIAKRAAPRLK